MGKNHWPPIKPHKHPVDPNPVNPNPPAPGVPLIWWAENADDRLTATVQAKDTMVTPAEAANVGIATLIIQRDNGTMWRVNEDKAPYTWVQVATDPYARFEPMRNADPSIPVTIPKWSRVIDDGFGRTYQLPDLAPGDSFEIVDAARMFGQKPVTIVKSAGDHFGFLLGAKVRDPDGTMHGVDPAIGTVILDTTGPGSVWRFIVIDADIIVQNVP